jgi:predicted nuclease of predicted toxin-antitoxin system
MANMHAVTAYLDGLRDARGLNDAEIAAALKPLLNRDVSQTTIWRVWKNKMVPSSDILLGIITVLRGNPADVLYLYTSNVSAEDARAMGERAAADDVSVEMIRDAWRRVATEQRDAARARIIAELTS